LKEALRLIDRTLALTALIAMAGCTVAVLLREPAIRLLFERGKFHADSTRLVAAAFFTLAPSFVGWSLIEILARSLFALDRRWPPVIAAAIPVLVNVLVSLRLGPTRPEYIGLGSSIGLLAGFAVLFVIAHVSRKQWLAQG
jgi:putative peptidoglycan lipid II flippase